MSSLPAGMFPRVAMSRHLLRRQGFGPQVAPGDSPIGIVVHVDHPVVALRQEPGCLAVVFPHLVGVPESLPAPPLDSLKLLVLVVVQGWGEARRRSSLPSVRSRIRAPVRSPSATWSVSPP